MHASRQLILLNRTCKFCENDTKLNVRAFHIMFWALNLLTDIQIVCQNSRNGMRMKSHELQINRNLKNGMRMTWTFWLPGTAQIRSRRTRTRSRHTHTRSRRTRTRTRARSTHSRTRTRSTHAHVNIKWDIVWSCSLLIIGICRVWLKTSASFTAFTFSTLANYSQFIRFGKISKN